MPTAARLGGANRGPQDDRIAVLHVDDDSEFLSLTAAALTARHEDIRIESVTEPTAALEQIELDGIDCLLSDYRMPTMDGLELLAAVREIRPRLPFVLYTGVGSEDLAGDAIEAGVTSYLRKATGPDHVEMLANRIRNAVASYRARRRAAQLEHVAGVVRDINQVLLRAETRQQLLVEATATLVDAAPYVAAWIAARESDHLELLASAGPVDDWSSIDRDVETTIDVVLARRALRTERVAVEQNVPSDPIAISRPLAQGEDYRSAVAIPLLVDAEPFGVLVVYSEHPFRFDDDEQGLLREVASDVGFAIHAIDLRERLQRRTVELEWYETIFETAQDGIFLIDVDGEQFRIRRLNPAQERLSGLETDRVRGKTLAEVLDGEQAARIEDRYRTCIRERATISYEHELDLPGGTRTYRTNLTPVVRADVVTNIVGITRDVTPLRHTQAELELLNRVLRHDIRNDVQVVVGWADILAERVDPDTKPYVQKILTTSQHIAELTDVARDLVETIVADSEVTLEPTAVAPILTAEVEKVPEVYDDATFSLTTTGDPAVMANEMLASVFRNVLNNAVQHNDSPDPHVEVTLAERDEQAVVRIADDGPGIDPSRRDAVFGKGERGLDSDGTGIGLYLVDTLIDLYDGDVRIEDNDPGTVVVIELPTVS